MNRRDYGSQPACQRLQAAGIVLKTEAWWRENRDGTYELVNFHYFGTNNRHYPALSMADVWRELPEDNKELALAIRDYLRRRERRRYE